MVGIGPEFGARAKLDAASHTLLLLRRWRGAPRPQSFGSKLSPANAVAWSSICRRKCVQKWMRNLRQLCAPSRPSRTGSQRVPSCYRDCVRLDPHARAAPAQLFHTSAAVQLGGHRGRVTSPFCRPGPGIKARRKRRFPGRRRLSAVPHL
jgi:hypothetical protein